MAVERGHARLAQALDRARTPRDIRPPEPIPPSSSYSSGALASLLGLSSATVTASEGTVAGIPALQAGIDMVSHAVAAMMTEARVFYRGRQLTFDRQRGIDERPPIVRRPAVLVRPFEFWSQACDCAMKRGNYVALHADLDPDTFYPRQVIPTHPDHVSLDDASGFPLYTVGSVQRDWTEVAHVRHGAPVGTFWGCGIVERYRVSVERLGYEQEYGKSSLGSGNLPTAVIQLDKPTVTNEEAVAVQDRFVERHGAGGTRRPAVIGKALSVQPLSWSPHDAEFIDSRRLSVAEAAYICGLDPADLGAAITSGTLTYANLTDRQLSRILQAFMPWLRLFEEAWTDMLPAGYFVQGNAEALLRSSTSERYDTLLKGKSLGLWTTDELREEEGRPPLPQAERDRRDAVAARLASVPDTSSEEDSAA